MTQKNNDQARGVQVNGRSTAYVGQNTINYPPQKIATVIGLAVTVLGTIIGAVVTLAPQEIKCSLGMLPSSCKGVYFVTDQAYISTGEADQRYTNLKKAGYTNASHFFIPDYPNLSGKHLYQVYADKFESRDECARFLEQYSKKYKESYCVRASSNPAVEPDRFCASSADCSHLDRLKK
jgi:hypothetical protein